MLVALPGSISTSKAQDKKNQFGLNVTAFVKQYLVLNSQSFDNNVPYLLTYRRFGKNFNLRAGLAASSSYNRRDDMSSFQFIYTDNRSTNLRIGIDRTYAMTKKWNLYYGLDLFGANTMTKQETKPKSPSPFANEFKYRNKTQTIGLSPNLTVEFMLNNRLSIFTETNLSIAWSHFTEKSESPSFPNSSQTGWSNFGSTTINLPLSVFCAFRF